MSLRVTGEISRDWTVAEPVLEEVPSRQNRTSH
jgi:hypothetical protein